jgi:hypothetical protein
MIGTTEHLITCFYYDMFGVRAAFIIR